MRFCLVLFALLNFVCICGQETVSPNYSRLPDKAYLHLDKNLYSQGDTIWAKAYVFHRNNNALSNNSYSLHIQVLSEQGKQVGTYKMLIVDGLGYGQMPVYESMKPGFYQIIAHTGHMKNFGQQFFYKQTIEVSNDKAEVSLKCFFNQESYVIGDTAKVMVSAYDEFQMLIPKKRFRYSLSHNEKVIKKGASRCSEEGAVSLWFPIKEGVKDDPYKLELTWYHEEADFSQTEKTECVFFPMNTEKLSIQFFPEGGNLIKGVNGRVAFEATNSVGDPVEVKGVLIENGEEILEVNSMHKGMGYFSLLPKAKKYTFRVTDPAVSDVDFELPEVKESGFAIAYLKQTEKDVLLFVSTSFDGPKQLSLWISQNDQLLNVYEFSVNKQRKFNLLKDILPEGLVTITITDEHNIPKAERLIYVTKEGSHVDVTLNENVYSQRKKVGVRIKTNHPDVKAHLSVSVIDSVIGNSPWLFPNSIKSYALLGSELKGELTNLDYYLGTSNRVEVHRNLLLMTHGWRCYSWITRQSQLDSIKLYDFNPIAGKVMKRSKPQANAKLTAMLFGQGLSFSEFMADENGRFMLTPAYNDRSSQKILFMAKNAQGKDNVRISLENRDSVLFGYVIDENRENLNSLLLDKNRYFSEDELIGADELPFLSYETKMLKELVVYGEQYNPEDEDAISESVTAFAAGNISGEDLVGGYSFASFVEQASFRAKYNFSTGTITVKSRGGSGISEEGSDDGNSDDEGAMIYVNDMRWGKDAGSLDFLTKEDIIEIVVLDPEGAYSMYGSEGEQGVILLRTRSQDLTDEKHTMSQNMAVFGKFINSKEFYQPVYETKQQDSLVVVDNRTTLHWSPFVTTDENGEAELEFYTDDIGGVKQVIIQGIDDDGHLYYQTEPFDVNVVGL